MTEEKNASRASKSRTSTPTPLSLRSGSATDSNDVVWERLWLWNPKACSVAGRIDLKQVKASVRIKADNEKVLRITVKTDVLLMETLQTSSATLVFDWQFELTKLQSARASCYIAFVPFSKIIWKAVCYSKFLLWLMMANIHYNRITRLKKGENNYLVHVNSKQAQVAEEVGLSPQINGI